MHEGMCLYYRIYWEGSLELRYLCSSLRTKLISYLDQAAHKDRAVIYRGYSVRYLYKILITVKGQKSFGYQLFQIGYRVISSQQILVIVRLVLCLELF